MVIEVKKQEIENLFDPTAVLRIIVFSAASMLLGDANSVQKEVALCKLFFFLQNIGLKMKHFYISIQKHYSYCCVHEFDQNFNAEETFPTYPGVVKYLLVKLVNDQNIANMNTFIM